VGLPDRARCRRRSDLPRLSGCQVVAMEGFSAEEARWRERERGIGQVELPLGRCLQCHSHHSLDPIYTVSGGLFRACMPPMSASHGIPRDSPLKNWRYKILWLGWNQKRKVRLRRLCKLRWRFLNGLGDGTTHLAYKLDIDNTRFAVASVKRACVSLSTSMLRISSS
jgi:hypothetical protein